MYCYLVHFTTDDIFVYNFKSQLYIHKTNHGNNLIFGTQEAYLYYFLKHILFSKKFNLGNPLKSTICSTSMMKLAVGRAIRGKNYQSFFGVFKVSL